MEDRFVTGLVIGLVLGAVVSVSFGIQAYQAHRNLARFQALAITGGCERIEGEACDPVGSIMYCHHETWHPMENRWPSR